MNENNMPNVKIGVVAVSRDCFPESLSVNRRKVTAFGWLYGTSPENRERALRYCGFEGDNWGEGGYKAPAVRAMIRALWASPAMLAIAPVQDLCGFGGDCKMNQPGIPEGNWAFRITDDALHQMDADWIRQLNRTYFRSSI